MVMNLEMIPCSRCGNDMPKLRLSQYGYDFCIKCSDVKPKVGRIRVVGEGDYTATELDVVDQDTAKRLQEMENITRGVRNIPLEVLNYDDEQITDNSRLLEEVVNKALDDELEEDIVEDIEEDIEEISEEVEEVDLEEDQD